MIEHKLRFLVELISWPQVPTNIVHTVTIVIINKCRSLEELIGHKSPISNGVWESQQLNTNSDPWKSQLATSFGVCESQWLNTNSDPWQSQLGHKFRGLGQSIVEHKLRSLEEPTGHKFRGLGESIIEHKLSHKFRRRLTASIDHKLHQLQPISNPSRRKNGYHKVHSKNSHPQTSQKHLHWPK